MRWQSVRKLSYEEKYIEYKTKQLDIESELYEGQQTCKLQIRNSCIIIIMTQKS